MTIDYDCIRDVLKYVADCPGDASIGPESELSKKYGWDVVEHNTKACSDEHFFLRESRDITDAFSIGGLSIVGAEKLSTIESNTAWSKVKPLLVAAGAKTVDMMFSIAASAIS